MDRLDNYSKIKVVGKGSFGQAILVQSKTDGQQYIMKQIEISSMNVKEKEEALNEVRVLGSLKHPNIVHYVTSFQEANKLCIIMEYAEGGDLYNKIQTQRNILLKEEQILDWFIQICLAVKYCHDKRILHRDLKTQNIFLTKKNTVKLGDFGIARVLRNTMEQARTMVGTPYYLSPELCQERPYNNKSDVWALGCVLYELVTLKHAFEGHDMKALVGKILRGIYPPVSSRYSKELRDIIDRMLQKDPKNRPSINTVLNNPYIRKRMDSWIGDPLMDTKAGLKQLMLGDVQSAAKEFPTNAGVNNDNRETPLLLLKKQEENKQIDIDRFKLEEKQKAILAERKRIEEKKKRIEEGRRIEDLQRRKKEEAFKRKQEEHALRMKIREDALRRKAQEEAALRKKAIEEAARRRERDEAERKKAFEEAKLQAYRNKLRAQQEEERQHGQKDRYEPINRIAERKPHTARIPQNHAADQVDDPLAEYRRQQYWEMRQARERNRARAEEQLHGDEPSIDSSAPSSPSGLEYENPSERKPSEESRDLLQDPIKRKVWKKSEVSAQEYKDMVINMIGKLNEQKDQIEDADDIFTSEADQATPMRQGVLGGQFKLNGRTLRLKNVSEKDSLYYRIEALRDFMEQKLGAQQFLMVFQLIDSQQQNDDDNILQQQIIQILGSEEKLAFVPLIHQLIFCEERQFANP